MEYFDAIGSCTSIGESIGEHFKYKISDYVEYRFQQAKHELYGLGIGFARSDYYDFSSQLIEYAEKNSAEEMEELNGVSRAANVSVEDILFAIGYTDIFDLILTQRGVLDKNLFNANAECTTFIYKRNGKLYCGQNWDMDEGSGNNYCYLRKRYSSGLSIQGLSTVIGLVHIGVNENGTFIGTANLCSQRNSANGLIFPMTIQHLLRKDVNAESMYWLRNVKKVGGHYFYVVQNSISSFAVECDEKECVVREISDVYAHSNHYRETIFENIGIVYSSDTITRCRYLEEELGCRNIDIDSIKEVLSNHSNNICRHNNGGYSHTCASIIYDVANHAIHLCDSNPCLGTWFIKPVNINL